jgi:hypothetical protein
MILCIVDNSNFINLFQKNPNKLDNTTQSSSSYTSNSSGKILEKIENMNQFYIISIPQQNQVNVFDSTFSQYLLNLTFNMAKLVIKYFNRLAFSMKYYQCSSIISQCAVDLSTIVGSILKNFAVLKAMKDHDDTIKMILAIIILLDDTSFLKDDISVSFTYFITNRGHQCIFSSIFNYIKHLIQLATSLEINDSVILALKLIYFWLKYSSKIIKSNVQLEEAFCPLSLIIELNKKLIFKIIGKINHLIFS